MFTSQFGSLVYVGNACLFVVCLFWEVLCGYVWFWRLRLAVAAIASELMLVWWNAHSCDVKLWWGLVVCTLGSSQGTASLENVLSETDLKLCECFSNSEGTSWTPMGWISGNCSAIMEDWGWKEISGMYYWRVSWAHFDPLMLVARIFCFWTRIIKKCDCVQQNFLPWKFEAPKVSWRPQY